jgi:tryptophan synthase alpha chain
MPSRIDRTFERTRANNEAALVAFITAGDPGIDSAPGLIAAIAEAGADIIELGIPYSDPLADGPVIQASSQRALDQGVTPPIVLDIVREARKSTDVPIVLMTSYNLVLQCGLEAFAKDAAEAGADGAILTDLPPEEAGPWIDAARAHGIDTIFLVAPTSTPERIRLITEQATGFVYCVSRTGVTGANKEMSSDLMGLLARARELTKKPLAVGFGISTPEHVAQVAGIADGAVIGSALVDFLHRNAGEPNSGLLVRDLISNWKAATKR